MGRYETEIDFKHELYDEYGNKIKGIDFDEILMALLKHPKSQTCINFSPMQLIGGRSFNIKPILLCLSGNFGNIP